MTPIHRSLPVTIREDKIKSLHFSSPRDHGAAELYGGGMLHLQASTWFRFIKQAQIFVLFPGHLKPFSLQARL